jgi:hypothetical protein
VTSETRLLGVGTKLEMLDTNNDLKFVSEQVLTVLQVTRWES